MIEGIFLLLGSNLGDRTRQLEAARAGIVTKVGSVVRQSAVYETAAWGNTDQPPFCNQVIEVASALPAEEILARINGIESALGRVRREKWGARVIDIDILYYGPKIITTGDLIVPHPGIPGRRFTLVPLVEIAPDFVHPVLRKTNLQLLNACKDSLEVQRV